MTTPATSQTVSWDDDSIKATSGGSISKFRLESQETARIVLIDENAYLAMTHYDKDVRRYVRCIKDIAPRCPGCEKLKDPKQRFGANIVRYKTDKKGAVLLAKKDDPTSWDFEIQLWTFGPDKFAAVRAIKKEWGDIRQRDLKVLCEKEDFQELIITPLPNALWLASEEVKQRVATEYKAKRYDVEKLIGRVYTPEEMDLILAGKDLPRRPSNSDSSVPSDEVINQSVADIEAELQVAEPPSESEAINFDELLADLT